MTKTQEASMLELNISDEATLAQRTAAAEALARGESTKVDAEAWASVTDPNATVIPYPKPTRKLRSDAGKPRPVKPQAAAPVQGGKLSSEQASRLLDLINTRDSKRVAWDAAVQNEADAHTSFDSADAAVIAFIRELTQEGQ